jgi:HAE1 family hydrophobic/amphiphilic exporter-1
VPLGVASLIGVLMLIGIVVTNAIVLVDLVNQYREKGLTAHDATVAGGSRRLRPILMTALATIFALTPMALGITGQGGFISQPLAIVVIGGLVSSTVLTLLVLPTLYNLVEGAKERRAARRRGTDGDGGGDGGTAPEGEGPNGGADAEAERELVGVGAGAGAGLGAAEAGEARAGAAGAGVVGAAGVAAGAAALETRRERRQRERGAVTEVAVPVIEEGPDVEVSDSAPAPAVVDAVPADSEEHAPASADADSPADSGVTVIDAVPTDQPFDDGVVAEAHEAADAGGPDAAEDAPVTESEALAAPSSEHAVEPDAAQPGEPEVPSGDTTETDADAPAAVAAPAGLAEADHEGASVGGSESGIEPAEQPETVTDAPQADVSTGSEVESEPESLDRAESAADTHEPESGPVADETGPSEEPEPVPGDVSDDGEARPDASFESEAEAGADAEVHPGHIEGSETNQEPASDRDGEDGDRRHDA